jgi:hypothetical protein
MTESKTFVIHGGVSKYHSCVPVAFYAVARAGELRLLSHRLEFECQMRTWGLRAGRRYFTECVVSARESAIA